MALKLYIIKIYSNFKICISVDENALIDMHSLLSNSPPGLSIYLISTMHLKYMMT